MTFRKSDIFLLVSIFISPIIANKIGYDKFLFILIGLFILGLIYRVYTMNKKDPKS